MSKATVLYAPLVSVEDRETLAERMLESLIEGAGAISPAQALRALLPEGVVGKPYKALYDAMWRRFRRDPQVGHLYCTATALVALGDGGVPANALEVTDIEAPRVELPLAGPAFPAATPQAPARPNEDLTAPEHRELLAELLLEALVRGGGTVAPAQALRALLPEGVVGKPYRNLYDAMWRRLKKNPRVGHLYAAPSTSDAPVGIAAPSGVHHSAETEAPRAEFPSAGPAFPAVAPQVPAKPNEDLTAPEHRELLAELLLESLIRGGGTVVPAQALRALLPEGVVGKPYRKIYNAMWRRHRQDPKVGHLYCVAQGPGTQVPLPVEAPQAGLPDRDSLAAKAMAAMAESPIRLKEAVRALLPGAAPSVLKREYDAIWRRMRTLGKIPANAHPEPLRATDMPLKPANAMREPASIRAPKAEPKTPRVASAAPKNEIAPRPRADAHDGDFARVSGGLNGYIDRIKALPMLKGLDERALFKAWREDGCIASRDLIIGGSLRFVVKQAMKYSHFSSVDVQDLIEDGNLGLFEALKRFDPERGIRFLTYAGWWTKMGIMNTLLHHGRTIRLPERMAESVQKVKRFIGDYERQHGVKPDDASVALATGYKERDIARIQGADMVSVPVDITARADSDRPDRSLSSPMDEVPDGSESPLAAFIAAEGVGLLKEMLAFLPVDEAAVVSMRFGFDGGRELTYVEIAERMGGSREWARKKELKALERLREALRRRGVQRS
jgi:RNA polymerase primary sigma factor